MEYAASPISVRDREDNPLSPTYYGVYLGSPDPDGELRRHVYCDKQEVLKIAKKCRTSRFKVFCSFEEAENFALKGPESMSSSAIPLAPEKSSPYKAPISQDLVKFRRCIEKDDFASIASTVRENPRYLVSSGDTPAILQEGARYNALHVAAKFDRPKVCEFILHCITSHEFIKKLYGEEEIKDTVKQRCDILLDLYLNTPDKAANETPLHFASKIAAMDVIKVLVSYDKCDKSRKNKQGQTALEVVASRKNDVSAELKNEIIRLLSSDYYIAVFRPLDPIRPPVLEGPFLMASSSTQNLQTLLDSEMRMSGVAGPMKYEEALNFKKLWKRPRGSPLTSPKSPCSTSPLAFSPSTFNKPDKVIERIGRELCANMGVYWVEYWPFLGDFANFQREKGLNMLERYFASRFEGENVNNEKCCMDDTLENLRKQFDKLLICEKPRFDSMAHKDIDNYPSAPQFDLNLSYSLILTTCQVYANKLFDSFTFLSSQSFYNSLKRCQELLLSCAKDKRYTRVEFNRIHSKVAALVKKKMCEQSPVQIHHYEEFLNDFIQDEGPNLNPSLLCICQKILKTSDSNIDKYETHFERGNSKCVNEEMIKHQWLSLDPCECLSSSKNETRDVEFKKIITKRKLDFKCTVIVNNSQNEADIIKLDNNENRMEVEEYDSDTSFKTPPSSPRLYYSCSNDSSRVSNGDESISSEDEMFSADEGAPITIEGDCLKDIDRTVYEALDKTKVTATKYPYIYQWMQECYRKYDNSYFSPYLSPADVKKERFRLSMRDFNLSSTPLSTK